MPSESGKSKMVHRNLLLHISLIFEGLSMEQFVVNPCI